MLIMATVTNTSPFGSGVIAVANPLLNSPTLKWFRFPRPLRGAGAGAGAGGQLGYWEPSNWDDGWQCASVWDARNRGSGPALLTRAALCKK
jgi:hypothetical protein